MVAAASTNRRKSADAEAIRRALRTRRIEAIAMGLLAVLPIVPYLTFLLRAGAPRFGLIGDHALLEQATRHVWSGDTLVGPWSQFKWSHPGPFFFYLAAPFQAVFGSSSTGLYVGSCVINAAAAATIASTTRLFARRSHGVAALVVVLAWFVAFGNIAANPWSPLVVVLPLMAFLVACALFGRGKSAAIYPAVLFGGLVAQTQVAVISTVIVSGVVALIAFIVSARRRGGLDRNERWRLAIAAAILLVLFVPPLVEQITTFPTGNLRKVWHFFVHREAPLKALEVAARNWAIGTTWLPERVLAQSLIHEGGVPLVARTDPMPTGVTSFVRWVSIAHFALIIVAAIIAGRRSDGPSLALLALGALADLIAVSALQAIVGPDYYYLVFWTTAASCVAWMGVLSTFFGALGAIAKRIPRISGAVLPALIVVGLSAAVTTASLQRFWIAKHPIAPGSHPELRTDLRAIQSALRQRIARDGTTAIVHLDGARDIAIGIVLELEKDRVDVRVGDEERAAFVGGRGYSGVAKPLHLWLATPAAPLKFPRCAAAPRQPAGQPGGQPAGQPAGQPGGQPAGQPPQPTQPNLDPRTLEVVSRSGDITLYGSQSAAPTCMLGADTP